MTNYISKKIIRLKIEIKRGYYLSGSGNLLKEAMEKIIWKNFWFLTWHEVDITNYNILYILSSSK